MSNRRLGAWPPEEELDGFKIGDEVEAHALKSAEHLNGLKGIVISIEGKRLGIDFGRNTGKKAMRTRNLTRCGEDMVADGAALHLLAAARLSDEQVTDDLTLQPSPVI